MKNYFLITRILVRTKYLVKNIIDGVVYKVKTWTLPQLLDIIYSLNVYTSFKKAQMAANKNVHNLRHFSGPFIRFDPFLFGVSASVITL